MKNLFSYARLWTAFGTAIALASIYPYIEANRRFSMRETAVAAMLSLYLCPLVVTLIARQRFVFWGVVTNVLLFVWLVLQVYAFREGWFSFRQDLSGLAIFCAFGLLSGALVGLFVERRNHRRHAV